MLELASRFPFNKEHFQLFCHPDCLLHEVGPDHPETPARLRSILRSCAALPVRLPLSFQIPPPALVSQLQRVHEKSYLMHLKVSCLRAEAFFMSGDNHIGPNTFRAVLAAGGCALAVAETLHQGGAGFALIRPPGHHAGRDSAEGFCFINHAALAIETIRLKVPEARFLVVDFDVHHGNGIDSLYACDPKVFYYSLHGEPKHIYPNSGYDHEIGQGMGRGFTRNISLPLGSSGDLWLQTFKRTLRDFEQKLRPDYILVGAGFDAHQDDPFGAMGVEDRHFLEGVRLLQQIAREQCGGRIGFFLEGGYSLAVLERLVPQIIAVLAEGQGHGAG